MLQASPSGITQMQHDLEDQLRALLADQRAAQDAANQAREALAARIQAARDGRKTDRPLKAFLEANDRATEALTRATQALERFRKAHPDAG
jgi:hypothetical protein